MFTFFFSGYGITREVSGIYSFPDDTYRYDVDRYLYCVEKSRVEFYGKYLSAYYCLVSKKWIDSRVGISTDVFSNGLSFMSLKKVVLNN